MQAIIYNNKSARNVVNKELSEIKTVSINLKDDCSILNPVITLQGINLDDLAISNYMYIPNFKRYYYIEVETIKGYMVTLKGEVDVLMSFSSEIKQCSAIVARQEKYINLYLIDSKMKRENKDILMSYPFPNQFNEVSYILTVLGG